MNEYASMMGNTSEFRFKVKSFRANAPVFAPMIFLLELVMECTGIFLSQSIQ